MKREYTESEYKRRLESQIISFQNIHKALTSGAWNLLYDDAWNLISVTWSDTLRKMLGFESTEDFPNTFEAWSDRLHPKDKARTLQEYELTVKDRTGQKIFDVEYRLMSKKGEYHWFRATGSLSRRADGSPDSFDGVFVNMDEKHEADERFRRVLKEAEESRNEARIDHEIISAVSRLYFSIFRIDLERDFYEEISSVNLVHRLTGHEGRAQEKLNELCDTIVGAEYQESVRKFFDLSTIAERMADTYTIDMEYRTAQGCWHEARFIEKKRNEKGKVTHILYVTRNVSEQKKQELEREHLQIAYKAAEKANEAKTNFLLNMSHDIRTPMNAILGYTQLMRKELTDPKLLHYQEMIEQSGNLLLSIINNVLDMARIESGKVVLDENYDQTGEILTRVCEVFEVEARKKGVLFEYNADVIHPHILVDITKVEELFTNLISNAIKYTPPGGKVTVSIKELPCEQEGYVLIQTIVADTGIGMSKEFLPHLFDSFSRERNTTMGKVAGSGLGMAIVKSLVDLMGGTIAVESKPGKGSKFTVILPHKIASRSYYEKPEILDKKKEADLFQGKHILLAEDNNLNAELAKIILEEMGFHVDRAEDGVICVNKLEQNPAGTYDVILMDIQMPNLDGYKATRLIRKLQDPKKAGIPIIAMTANAFAEDRKRAMESGMNGHIAKPIDIAKVKEILGNILHQG